MTAYLTVPILLLQLAYRYWCGRCDVILSQYANCDVANLYAHENEAGVVDLIESNATSPKTIRPVESSQTQRRACNYLQVLASAPQSLATVLTRHPYDMPAALLERLKSNQDICVSCFDVALESFCLTLRSTGYLFLAPVQSIVRRTRGVHFDLPVANEMVVMARMAVMWCEARPSY